MNITGKDRTIIRDLAKQVAEIAAWPIMEEKRKLWRRLNSMERVRPLVTLENGTWHETRWFIDRELKCESEEARLIEWNHRSAIWNFNNIKDDSVCQATAYSWMAINDPSNDILYGIEQHTTQVDHQMGAVRYNTSLSEDTSPDIIPTPNITVDWEETERRYQEQCELYDGILEVYKYGRGGGWFTPMDVFVTFRGIEQTFIDMVERPDFIHSWLEKMTWYHLYQYDQYEKHNVLTLNNNGVTNGPGGLGLTDELPQKDFDGIHVRTKDMWSHAATQIFSEVSPAMHKEFALDYEARYLSRFGLCNYGCCEPLDMKVDMVLKAIPNIRRMSMSPKANVRRGAEAIGRRCIFSWKPNPTMLSMESWDPKQAEGLLREGFEATRNCVTEVIMKDLHNVRNEPHRMIEWTDIAMRLAEEYA
jgi:hypothetical protein